MTDRPGLMQHGVLVIDKPGGMTSHDVVAEVRRIVGTRKVGHLGTLDPAATGVLPVAVGKATRLARYFPTSPKEYMGRMRLGWETTTGDDDGEALGEVPVPPDLTRERVVAAMAGLTGEIEQVPPAYSAKKIGGVAAYKLARKGKPADLRPVSVTIESFTLERFELPELAFRVLCSTGTYVRSLARDLGRALGTRAHLTALRRTRAGVFTLAEARPLDDASTRDVIPSGELLGGMAAVTVGEDGQARIGHGDGVPCDVESPTVRILNKRGELIAIGAAREGWVHPKVVLI